MSEGRALEAAVIILIVAILVGVFLASGGLGLSLRFDFLEDLP